MFSPSPIPSDTLSDGFCKHGGEFCDVPNINFAMAVDSNFASFFIMTACVSVSAFTAVNDHALFLDTDFL